MVQFVPRSASPTDLSGDAAKLFAEVKHRSASALAILSLLLHSRTHECVTSFPLHGNLERADKVFFYGQVSVAELRKFARRQHWDLDGEEYLLDALTALEQLCAPPHPPVVRLAAVEAIILLSDIFSHPRFIWLYGLLQRLHVQSEITGDGAMQPYTLLGMCKAVAVLQWDKEQSRYEFLANALNEAFTHPDISLRTIDDHDEISPIACRSFVACVVWSSLSH